ncbi:hypothetical protein [Burkholderia latens]|uniref:hypothetical protein n=1 Tax=Burkholderia latens TaxID=488446 RepID=UPI001AE87FE7|nr:hypothetical protein [Burkholderia latens]QTO42413.1 hypothetical protein J8I85_10030 [Burkholderia latens]
MEAMQKLSFSLPTDLIRALDAERERIASETFVPVSMNSALRSVLTRALVVPKQQQN